MNLQIIGKNITITEGIKSALESKFSKLDKHFNRPDVSGRVVARTYPVGTKLEITIFTPQMILRAEANDPDLYNAMDIALEKIEGQMRKLKTRMEKKQKRLSFAEALVLEAIEDDKKDSDNEEVVRTKSIYLEPMTVDEAIARMDAIDHKFFLYLDVDENKICVVYHREEGGYGLLEADNKIK